MAEQNKQLPSFSFGNFGIAPASSASSDASAAPKTLFGNTPSGLFGNPPASSAAQSNPTTTATPSPFSGFGATSGPTSTTGAGTSPFSGFGASPASNPTTTASSFGGFGATSGSNPPTTASPFGGGLGTTSGASSGAQGGSLFGTSTGQPGGLFGGASGNARGVSQGASMFGSGDKPASTGFSFGKQPDQVSTQNPAATPNLFGRQPDQPKPATPAANTGLFGKQPDQPTTSTSATTASLFGDLATPNKTPATGNMTNPFGNPNNIPNRNQNQASILPAPGTPSANQPDPTFGGFGSTTPAGPPPQSGAGGGGLFNSNPQTKPPTSNLFGNPSTGTSASSGTTASNQGSASNTGTNFFTNFGKEKNAPPASTQSSTQGMFGSGATTSKPGGWSFTQPTASTSQSTPASSAAPASKAAPFSFPPPTTLASDPAAASAPQPPASHPASAPTTTSLFAPLNATTAALTASGGAPISSLLGPGSTNTTTAGAGAPQASTAGPFGGVRPPASTTSSEATTSATAPATTTAATLGAIDARTGPLGASTTGPTPSAQSRLRNKTMDEILTRWASDLTKYQKEFQNQAERVAGWDRMAVDNSEKIQKLYGRALEAERATVEVEKQLTVVESQQDELSNWLDNYESKVDDMMNRQMGQGDGLQGPDQERERTYKVAEKLSERLDDMGRDLTTMIDEINGASAALTKNNKEDEPITQIVRILNSHLSQLQQIDQGAKRLQDKVTAAQRSSQTLTMPNGQNEFGGTAADDFYRSYMGRR